MFHQKYLPALIVFIAATLIARPASAQITIDGVADKANYNNRVAYRVRTQAGFTDAAFLNGLPVTVGVSNTITRPDYYELFVHRTNDATSAVTNLLVRFLVNASARGTTEWGLPPHTPFPLVQSSSNEFAGARLRLITPQDFPAGFEIPVVAWVVDEAGHAVRANGLLTAPGQPPIQLRRGVGSGFMASNNPAGAFDYAASVGGLITNKLVTIESATSWTPAAGTLNGSTVWPDGARIRVTSHLNLPAGASLTIGPGAIVLLNPGVNITNNGSITINGTVDRPVVFMPVSRAQPWGGFFMRTSTGLINATGTIFTGSGADPSGGAGHRPEQCLFLCDSTPRVTLMDSAAIYLAGQLGHAYSGGTFNFTRFLMQRTTTGGEYTGASFTVNDSAFIECPDDTANFVDGDNDGLYLVSGTHSFTNTLFGWTKDDGVDSGGDGFGRLHYEGCWFEATFHEGNSLSGSKNTTAHGTVYFDCGQGIEDGYGAPTGRVDHCLFLVNESGVRHGDNYPSIGNYTGRITATNCILLQNHRDLFGYNWRPSGFTNAWGQFFANNNFLTRADTNFPNNFVWNPSTDAGRLIGFGAAGRVGVALAVRAGQTALTNFLDGVPVALSLFCTNPVSVDYLLETGSGPGLGGTLVFAPGEVRKFIPAPNGLNGALRVSLSNPQNADLTGASQAYFQSFTPGGGVRVQIGRFGEEAALYWSDGTYRLQRAAELPSVNWTNMPGSSPVPINPAGPKQFFRLAK